MYVLLDIILLNHKNYKYLLIYTGYIKVKKRKSNNIIRCKKKRNSYSNVSIRYKDKRNIVSIVSIKVKRVKETVKGVYIIVSIKVQVKRNKRNIDSIVSITI